MLLCVSLGSTTLEQMQTDFACAVAEGADVVEVRLDCLSADQRVRLSELEAWFRRNAARLIISFRPVEQGGQFDGLTADRLSTLLWAGSCEPRFVDVEYACYGQSPETADKLRMMFSRPHQEHWPGVLLSEHHLEQRPTRLQNKFLDMCSTPAETIKLVWRARSATDNFEALDLLWSKSRPATAFCVEADGLPSRVLGRKFESDLTYCALRDGRQTAPGQPTLRELIEVYGWRAIDRHTEVYGLIGNPVAHSLSPQIHNAALQACELNAVYVAFRVESDGFAFADFMKAVAQRPWLDVRGFSVTAPHKHNAWLLAEDELDPISRRIGAVNTLRFAEDTVTGCNTDYQAATNWLLRGLHCDLADLAEHRFDILGAGGFARAVVVALRVLKAPVTVYNRNVERAEQLAGEFGCTAAALNDETALSGDAVVNCTSVGMWPHSARTPIHARQLNPQSVVFDAVYNPLETQLLRDARAAGCRTVQGVELFIDQAVMQFTALTGRLAPREVMRDVALASLQT